MPLILTKLNRPLMGGGFIRRQRLDELLANCFQKTLTVVSAAAGSGKSSLVSSHMELCDFPNAWVSLDKDDNDLGLFLSYFLSAIQGMFPEAVRETFGMVNEPQMPTLERLTTSLVNELSQIERPFALVLDDYHRIQEQSVHDLISRLLLYPPPALHLIIISRSEPPLSIASYRTKGHLLELDTQDLRFTKNETAIFLSKVLQHEVSDTSVASWQKKTEGWVTGLQLATLGRHNQIETGGEATETLNDVRHIKEYFYNEVFAVQSQEIQTYLLFSAILDRLNGPLIEALSVAEETKKASAFSGWDFISWLKKENLFLIPLDKENIWYRYHHLLRRLLLDLLTRHYGHDHIVLLHQRASCWFAENDLFEEALLHTFQAEDMECATELIGQAGFQLIENQEWLRLQRWLNMLPYEAVEQNPQLIILKAWLFEVQGNRSGVSETLDKIETLKVTLNPEALAKFDVIKGHYEALGAMTAYAANAPKKALMLSLNAIKNIPIQQKRALSLAHIVALGSRQLLGDLEDGLCLYKESINASEIAGSNYHSLYIALSCFIYWIDADLLSFQNTAEAAQRVLEKNYMVESAAFVNYYQGIAAYHMNDFDSAEARLSKVVYANQICNSFLYAHSSFALALVFQSRGEFVKARECCAAVTAHAIDINNDIVLAYARGFSVELELRRGEFKEARRWMKGFHVKSFSPPYLFYLPELTLAKALLMGHGTKSRQQAASLLDDLGAFLTSVHNKVFMIDVLALQALLCKSQGDYAAALDKLDEALTLAEPGHWLRPFLDLGAAMKVLLLQMHKQGRNLDYVEQILSAFEDHGVTLTSPRLSNAGDNKIRLTNREIEVLMLVGRRLTDKEVAKELSISFETVRAHMKNIRKKMKVSSRVLAVDRAVELKLLTLSKA